MTVLFDASLDEWRNWDTTPAQWLITNNEVPLNSATLVWVADVAPWEVTVPGYSRQTVTGATRTVDTSLHRVTYTCDSPTFGVLDNSPPYLSGLYLAYTGTDDTDSLLLAAYSLGDFAGGPIDPIIPLDGVHWVAQG